jgi:hypothetical protein
MALACPSFSRTSHFLSKSQSNFLGMLELLDSSQEMQ